MSRDVHPWERAERQRAGEHERRREHERRCSARFLTEPHPHEQCVRPAGEECSRDYNPTPDADARPADPRFYEGTGIGALYGDPAGVRLHLWTTAGWNVRGLNRKGA